jgi:pimeloyl-ACP methyl ester carboxylesterase
MLFSLFEIGRKFNIDTVAGRGLGFHVGVNLAVKRAGRFQKQRVIESVCNDLPAASAEPSRRVIALHCSGASAAQWRELGAILGAGYELTAPEHYGGNVTGHWPGEHVFALADEAQRTIDLIDQSGSRIHLVGHSYGGGVALHVALRRPHAIASLTLYEPSAFHVLKKVGADGIGPFAEIKAVTQETGARVLRGDYRGAAAYFIDYWGGDGAWSALLPHQQRALVRWAPKAPLDFGALIEEPSNPEEYSNLHIPVLIMHGEHALKPSRTIAEALRGLLPRAELEVIAGAGHMGPFTHGAQVNAMIASHITDANSPAHGIAHARR